MARTNGAMTCRERVMAAVARQRVDRAPARFNCDPGPVGRRIAAELGLPLEGDWFEALNRRLRIDMRYVDATVKDGDYGGDTLALAEARSAADVDRLWPRKWRPENRTFAPAREQVARWDDEGVTPAVQVRLPALFNLHRRMRGENAAFLDLAEGNAVLTRGLDRMTEFNEAMIDLAFDTLGDRLDLVGLAEELGMQTGLMYSPATIRKEFFPRLGRLFARARRRGAKVFYHSCGAIEPLIEELIDLGVDVLNPIQPRLPGMEPEHLAARFGGRVCFCGGIDMQRLLPQGTPAEVRREVERYVGCLGPGYIIDAANILHPDIPTGNVKALYEAKR
jgi:uroporphyrinogen decarboxylase